MGIGDAPRGNVSAETRRSLGGGDARAIHICLPAQDPLPTFTPAS